MSSDQVDAEANEEERKGHPKGQVREDTRRVHRLVIQQSPRAHEADGRAQYDENADDNERVPGAETKRPRNFSRCERSAASRG